MAEQPKHILERIGDQVGWAWRLAYLTIFLIVGVLYFRIHKGTPALGDEGIWVVLLFALPWAAIDSGMSPLWILGLLVVLIGVSLWNERNHRDRFLTALGPSFALLVLLACANGIPKSFALWLSSEHLRGTIERLKKGELIVNEEIGVFQVDRAALDLRGGAYFETHHGYGWGPAHYFPTEGLAWKPNTEGSPFEDERFTYRLEQISGDWYWFSQYLRR